MLPIAENMLSVPAQAETGLKDPQMQNFPTLPSSAFETLGRWLKELWFTQWTA